MRRETLTLIVIGGVVYQAGKYLLGFPLTPAALFDGIYWSAAALLIHWRLSVGHQ